MELKKESQNALLLRQQEETIEGIRASMKAMLEELERMKREVSIIKERQRVKAERERLKKEAELRATMEDVFMEENENGDTQQSPVQDTILKKKSARVFEEESLRWGSN